MYSVRPRISDNWSTNDKLNALIDAIDRKVLALASCKLMNIQYDTYCAPDLDLYEDLVTYRRILLEKLLGCGCFTDQRLIKIVSRIKKLLQ